MDVLSAEHSSRLLEVTGLMRFLERTEDTKSALELAFEKLPKEKRNEMAFLLSANADRKYNPEKNEHPFNILLSLLTSRFFKVIEDLGLLEETEDK